MKRDEMLDYLGGLSTGELLPIWVISHTRAGDAPFLDRAKAWATSGNVNVLVGESQYPDYALAYPELTVHWLPDEVAAVGVGRARWAAANLAYELGQDTIIMMDDDVLKLDFLFEGHIHRGPNAGAESSRASTTSDHAMLPDLWERILTGFSDVAQDVLRDEPRAMMGGMIKRHMSFSPNNHRTEYQINSGVTPRQVMVWAVGRMLGAGVDMDPRFYRHGDDIGIIADILAKGGDCWAVPSFAYDHWPESVNIEKSTLRNAGNVRELLLKEHEDLLRYPIAAYLKTKRSVIDDSPEWHDVNWKALAKVRGVEFGRRVEWPTGDDLI